MVKRFILLITAVLTALPVTTPIQAQQPALYKVDRLPFNTGVFNEISPVIINGGLGFCSDKRFSIIRDRIGFDGRRLYNIYTSGMTDSSAWKKPEELKSERNTLFNNGPFCIAPDNKTVYFTSEVETGAPAKKKNFKNHSGIFLGELTGNELISLRPFRYNSPDYDIGQPSVSSDGKYLYFASNMPGGQGGSDIYYCEFSNDDWSAPVNLGPGVNTSQNENYPYYHSSGRLYFTSDRPGGAGSFDIYFSSGSPGFWEEPVLLPEPVNSPSDDFSLVADGNLQKGYFASNRKQTDDIYSFESTIIRKAICDDLAENSYCYRFVEENAEKNDTMPFRYEWRFGDGLTDSGAVVEHCYKGPGTYIVQLDVVNLLTKEVSYNEKSDTLVVTNIEQAYISAPDSTYAGQGISLSAGETNLPGWNIAQYYWNFGDETVAVGIHTDKTFAKPGVYNVQLIVNTGPEPGGSVRETCVSRNIVVLKKP